MTNLSWQIGDITITRLVERESLVPGGPGSSLPDCTPEAILGIPWLVPHFANAEGMMRLSVHALLIQTPTARLIVDTCIGNDKVRHVPHWNGMQTDFLADLTAASWDRNSVDGVLCTHLHVDHVGWNTMLQDGAWVPTFPNARYYFGRREYEHWTAEMAETTLTGDCGPLGETIMDTRATYYDSVRPIVDAGLATMVEMDAVIAPGVRLMPTPGHTPGHVSVVVESGGDRAIITGDMMHHPVQIARPEWASAFDTDQTEGRGTRWSFLAEVAETPTLVIGTHFAAPTAGRVVRDGESFRLEA